MKQQITVYLVMLEQGQAKEDVSSVALLLCLQQLLQQSGVQVKLDCTDDTAQLVQASSQVQPDAALIVSTAIQAERLVVYHQVTNDWMQYSQSYRLADQLIQYSTRYRMLYNRTAKAGSQYPWLCQLPCTAVYLELGITPFPNENLPQMAAQAKACARAILEQLDVPYRQVPTPTAFRAQSTPELPQNWMQVQDADAA